MLIQNAHTYLFRVYIFNEPVVSGWDTVTSSIVTGIESSFFTTDLEFSSFAGGVFVADDNTKEHSAWWLRSGDVIIIVELLLSCVCWSVVWFIIDIVCTCDVPLTIWLPIIVELIA